ncbi:MAG: amino acid adenylation domain-containing protein [Actinomycetota bacterium]|nr:amino acid adenylation domain-containing protein [Actinomycetota bacterium]
MVEQDLNIESLRRTVADLVEEDPGSIGEDANLFALGLDSIALMQLVGRWRQAAIEVNFADLAENPTIGAWSKLMSTRKSAAATGTGVDIDIDIGSDADGKFPLAIMQRAYWVGRGKGHRLGGVAAHLYTEFDGADVDPDRLRTAIERLVTRHDMLRARFTAAGQQQIERTSGWRGLAVHDLRGLDHEQSTARLELIRDTLSHQMLDIEHGEVFSTALSLLPGGRTRLHIDVDMLAADAVSYRILLADLAWLYEQPDVTLPAVGYSYRQYRAARPESRREAVQRAAEWWQDRLPDLPGAPELPLVAGSDLVKRTGPVRVSRRYFTLPAQQRAALTDAARQRGLTPAMVVATAFAEVLGAWSAQPRFLLNVPLFDREPLHPDVGKLVGDFTSSVLLEVDLTERVEFTERVRRIQSRMHTDAAHADYSGVEVLRDLTRRNGEQVLAPVVFTSALSLGELFDAAVRRSFGDPVWIISQGPQVLLDAQITEVSGGLLVNWDVREQEFADGVVDAMFAVFEQLVRRLAERDSVWETPVDELLPAGQRATRERVNDTAGPYSGRLLHEGFFTISHQNPGSPALLWGERGALPYGDLADRALRVAAALRTRGVAPGDPVGVTLPKGVAQVEAVLGILAAGGVYVPIGVEQPDRRRASMLTTVQARWVITDSDGRDGIAWPPDVVPVVLAEAVEGQPATAPVPVDPEQSAYVLFTSGSTGQPKGVEVPHRAAMNTIDDLIERFVLGSADRTLGISALDFDLSVFDLFAPLSVGGAVVMVDQEARRDARGWGELIRRHRVTVLNCVPALLDMVLSTGADLGASLRLVLLGGDWVHVDLPGRLASAVPGCRFVGLGGTTETAIHSTVCEVRSIPESWRSVPYGTPLRNVRCRVVDQSGRDRPDWVPGELWIGGMGVAHGYRADPGRTAERFVLHDGQRWYRTGDRARYWPDGTLEFLGRQDNQIKIRGHRTELGEIETTLETHPQIGRAIVAVFGERTTTLIAAVTTHPGHHERVATAPQWCSALDRVLLAPQRIDQAAPPATDAEAELVEALLTHLLTRRCEITDRRYRLNVLATQFGVADDQRPVFQLWLSWLAGREVLTVDEGGVAAGARFSIVTEPERWPRLVAQATGTALAPVATRLAEQADDLVAMLCGELNALTLLEDPVLAPEALIGTIPAATSALGNIADSLNNLANSLERSLRIVELGARTGRTAAQLLKRLPPDQVDYTLADSSARLLTLAKQRLANQPHQLRFHRLTGDLIPDQLHRHFDVVLANNALHAFDQVTAGVASAAELLTPHGVLLALEQTELSPLAMIAAALPTRGFSTLDNDRRQRGTPLLEPQQWCRLLAEHGFERMQAWHQEGTPALIQLRACRATGGAPIRTAEVRDWLAERLPAHMIPNRFVVLPRLPLSANDKVDRTRVRWLLERDTEPEPADNEPACGRIEETVSATWAEVLGISTVSRTGNFFALGGDSMLLLKVQTLLARRLRREIAIVDLYRYPTVTSLAAHLGTAEEKSDGLDRVAARARRQRRARQGRPAGSPRRETNHRA